MFLNSEDGSTRKYRCPSRWFVGAYQGLSFLASSLSRQPSFTFTESATSSLFSRCLYALLTVFWEIGDLHSHTD